MNIHLIGLEKYLIISMKNFMMNVDIKKSLQRKKLINERDTSDVWRQFAIWLLVDEEYGVIRFTKPDSKQYQVIKNVANLYIDDCKDAERWHAAMAAAEDATDAAYSAAYPAAWAAASAAYYAAWCAKADAADAYADATIDAAAEAATDADPYVFADAAYDDEADAHFERMANKLIELLQAAPMITTNK